MGVLSLKSFFIGPSCVGKTTARRRLTHEIDHLSPKEIVPSTGIDAPLTVQLYHDTDRSSVLLSEFEGGWRSQGLEEQCRTLCSLVINTPLSQTAPSSSLVSQPRPSSQSTATVPARGPTEPLSNRLQQKLKNLTSHSKDKETTALTDELTTALSSLVKALGVNSRVPQRNGYAHTSAHCGYRRTARVPRDFTSATTRSRTQDVNFMKSASLNVNNGHLDSCYTALSDSS